MKNCKPALAAIAVLLAATPAAADCGDAACVKECAFNAAIDGAAAFAEKRGKRLLGGKFRSPDFSRLPSAGFARAVKRGFR